MRVAPSFVDGCGPIVPAASVRLWPVAIVHEGRHLPHKLTARSRLALLRNQGDRLNGLYGPCYLNG